MDYAVLLGTSSAVIYKREDGIVLNEANCITTMRDGRKIKIIGVGNAAKYQQEKYEHRAMTEPPINGGRIANLDKAKMFFDELYKKVRTPLGRRAVFCVPCSLTAEERGAFKCVGDEAGLTQVDFLPAPVSSAFELGGDLESSAALLSVVISQSGTDIAVISNGSIIQGGSIEESGAYATAAVKDYIENAFKISITDDMAERAKTETATLLLNDETSFKVQGLTFDDGSPCVAEFTGEDCYKVLHPIYGRIVRAVLQVVSGCPAEIQSELKKGTVYVGGGASSVMGLREFLSVHLDMNVVLNANSVNAPIMGLGKLLSHEKLLKKLIKSN